MRLNWPSAITRLTVHFTCGLDVWCSNLQANKLVGLYGYTWHWMSFLRLECHKTSSPLSLSFSLDHRWCSFPCTYHLHAQPEVRRVTCTDDLTSTAKSIPGISPRDFSPYTNKTLIAAWGVKGKLSVMEILGWFSLIFTWDRNGTERRRFKDPATSSSRTESHVDRAADQVSSLGTSEFCFSGCGALFLWYEKINKGNYQSSVQM